MPLSLASRGGALLRRFPVNALARPHGAAAFHAPARRVNLATAGRFSNPVAGAVYNSVSLSGHLINSYATATHGQGRTAGAEGRRTTKTSKTSKGKKAAKKTTKKATRASAKKKPAKKPVLTDRQRKLREKKERRDLIRQLKATALQVPKPLPNNVWAAAVKETYHEASKTEGNPLETLTKAVKMARPLVGSDTARLQAIVDSNKAANAVAYEEWLNSHSPLQIKDANRARQKLNQLTKKKLNAIQDDRLVKRPRTAFSLFVAERSTGGDFRHMMGPDLVKHCAKEYKEMTEAEKEKYKQLQDQEVQRYRREHQEVYGMAVPPRRSRKAATT